MPDSDQSTKCFDRPRFLTAGDSVLMVQLGNQIDEQLSDIVLSLDAELTEASPEGMIEVVPSYTGLSIYYDPLRLAPSTLQDMVRDLFNGHTERTRPGRRWIFPTAYGGQFGQDLEPVAERHGMSQDEVVRRHSSVFYRVYMLGFMPGFAFMGGLDPRLATERLASPRARIPAGSVGVGGEQTGIFSIAAPSGWHMLGRSPVRTFDPRRDEPFLLSAGDKVKFEPINHSEWDALEGRAFEGDPLVAPLP